MEDEKCYLFRVSGEPGGKRRKVEPKGIDTSLEIRKRAYASLWQRQEQQIHDVVRATNTKTLADILTFVNGVPVNQVPEKVPTALITTGSGSISHDGLFELLDETISQRREQRFISLQASEAPNLKTLLKNINQKGTSEQHDDEVEGEDGVIAMKTKTPRLLNYDLEILRRSCEEQGCQRIVLALQDGESFDVSVLTDLFTLLHSWLDRLPIVLLVGIATSIDMFHDRLTRIALRCLSGQSFDVTRSQNVIEQVYECSAANEDVVLRIGAGLSDVVLQRQKDHVQSVEAFTNALKYAYMCHFYGNPLSVFLSEELRFQQLTPEDLEALRNLPSFRRYAETLLEQKQVGRVRQLLQSNEALFKEAATAVRRGRVQVVWLLGAIRIIQSMRSILSIKNTTPFSYLYIKALSGELLDSAALRELLLLLKKSPSDMIEVVLQTIVDTLITMPASEMDVSPDDFQDITNELAELTKAADPATLPLRSANTQAFLQRMQPKGRKSQHSPDETAYAEIVARLHDLLINYFSVALISVQSIFLNEILFYDLKASHRDVFTPRPRFAIERALATPNDYLACNCCSSKDALSPTQPPTAILFQLYLEAGAQINTFDLFTAFSAIMSSESNPDEYDEDTIMTLFYRGLAELKHIDLIRSSKRKVDHLKKTAWKGL